MCELTSNEEDLAIVTPFLKFNRFFYSNFNPFLTHWYLAT